MKSFIASVTFASLFGTVNVMAANSTQCDFNDWQRISNAVKVKATTGEQYRTQVKAMLTEEMGPACVDVTPASVPGIPGNRYYQYLLKGSGQRNFLIKITIGGVEQPGTRLNIEKK